MASLWQPFERSVVEFLTRTTLSQDEFVKFLAGAYTVATTPISQDDLNQALDFAGVDQIQPATGNDLKAKIISSAVVNDPVVLFPSPIVLFPGNPIQLAKDLHFAMSKSFTPQATAKNLVKAFKNHLSSIVGIYIGFKDPATPPQPLPFTIVVFNGIS
jgi:hypothetical protein